MSEAAQRPTSGDDREGWKAYWTDQGMPWRTEPEIDEERQAYLAERRAVKPNIERGIYPFRDENGSIKLTRADVEWLLATHESAGMVGPVDLLDERQWTRDGLDLRGVDLRDMDLRVLPLARVQLGLTVTQRPGSAPNQREAGAAHLEGARLDLCALQQATLYHTHLESAALRESYLAGVVLEAAHLEGANLYRAHLEGASMRLGNTRANQRPGSLRQLPPADMRRAFFDSATNLKDVALGDAAHGFVSLVDVHWGSVNLVVSARSRPAAVGHLAPEGHHTGR